MIFLHQLLHEQQMFKAINVRGLVQLIRCEAPLYEHLKRSATHTFTAFCKQYCCATLLENVDRVPKRVERRGKSRMRLDFVTCAYYGTFDRLSFDGRD